ncbi:MAG: hypothetical protein EOL95_10745 [Bacteroidia bacterium]|nr:hypothetical protein [Bacteroidia bacterium]
MDKKKPNLFIIGASKCGTTSLWHMLKQHTKIFMSTPKEPWFFSFSNYLSRLPEYEKLFERAKAEKFLGEASPIYSETTLIPNLPQRIYNYNPNAKIIYIVREPISRLKSVWRQALSTTHWYYPVYKNYTDVEVPLMPKNFKKAIFEYPQFLEVCKYWTHLNHYRQYFDDKNILLLFFEDLKSNEEKVYREICKFLELEPEIKEGIFNIQNSGKGKKMYYSFILRLKKNNIIYKIGSTITKLLNIKIPKKPIKYNVHLDNKTIKEINSILKIEKIMILEYGHKKPDFWEK